ncbi:Hypothetical protein IALB_2563 [Ignavibacterium album JCM 16511]|uniref:Uncharacterized protein n=1 Tax=Ignavibacterium album (strain DSM 19864 / JCM 16511 / NBRC 101810 / Mat9-16) TaxID=945713 RepID=I0AMQ9_IGNAJ|nr:hypothetical protein [Ignavibacterium album]AFH50266.1 Hypothetical protein IALB_2563 [Ignavibacterium album JCM 16511]
MIQFDKKDLITELEKIASELNTLDGNNFDQKFPTIKKKMCEMHEITERTYYLYSEADQKKISQASKLIKEAFDNVLRKWMDRTEEVKNELDLCMKQKKILSYKRF